MNQMKLLTLMLGLTALVTGAYFVKKGDTLAVVASSSKEKSKLAGDILASTIKIQPQKPNLPQLILDVIS